MEVAQREEVVLGRQMRVAAAAAVEVRCRMAVDVAAAVAVMRCRVAEPFLQYMYV